MAVQGEAAGVAQGTGVAEGVAYAAPDGAVQQERLWAPGRRALTSGLVLSTTLIAVEALAARHLTRHGGDVERSLAEPGPTRLGQALPHSHLSGAA